MLIAVNYVEIKRNYKKSIKSIKNNLIHPLKIYKLKLLKINNETQYIKRT
jgi:hypothetical protein